MSGQVYLPAARLNEYAHLSPNRGLSTVYLEAMGKLDIPQFDNLNERAPWLGSYSTDMGECNFLDFLT